MKTFKKLAIFATALILALSFGAFASCGDGNTSSPAESSPEESSIVEVTDAYKFIVKHADGTPAVGYAIQLCLGMEFCMAPADTDANGVAIVNPADYQKGADAYDIHVLIPNGNGGYETDAQYNYVYAEFNESATTPATYGEVTLTLKN